MFSLASCEAYFCSENNGLDYRKIKFPVSKEDFSKIEMKNNICPNVF